MNREALFSVLKLFAYVFRNGDAGCDFFVESSIEKKFLGVLLKEEEKKKFREYYAVSKKEILEKLKSDPEEVLKEIVAGINRHHLIKSKFLLIVYLLETIKISFPEAIAEMEEIADRLRLNKAMYSFLFDFAFSADPYSDHTDNTMVIDGMEKKIGNYVHFMVPDFKGEILILKLREFDFLLGRSFYPRPVFVNETPVMNDEIFILEAGQTIRQGVLTISFSDIALDFIEETIEHKYSLVAENVGLKFSEKAEVLRNINLCEESGNMVGIMGASGAGKTTLLNVLTGIEKPTSGEVRINGGSLHKDPLKFEGVIGYISQDDLLLEDLSVFQNLYFNAQLIFKNVSKPALQKMVLKTLSNLGLLEIKDLKVGSPLNKKISGGQRKRLNIALELIREPAVLFVDEPTSGLSSRDSEMVMQLLKELA
ncbi:MAG: ABC transporter ATP-binding protein, partial [Bacteroidia bacterium]|nr:ABC transporter ATP-binding protein [Bacteroidia bacterium]